MKVTTWINITAMENGDKPSGWRFSTWLLQNLIQTLRKDGFFPKFLTGFQLGLGQLWPHLWCGILDTLVQKSTGECCKIPQAREEQSRNPSYPSLWQMFSPLLQSYLFLLFFVHRRVIQRAAQPLFWTGHGGSLHREGHLGLRKLRNAVLSHQQCRRQLHSSLFHMGMVRRRSQFPMVMTSASCRNAEGLKSPVSAQDTQHFRNC